MMINQKSRPIILLGAGGHAKVLLSLLKLLNYPVMGVCAPELVESGITCWRGVRVLGDDSCIRNYTPQEVALVNGIGQGVASSARSQIFKNFKNSGYFFPCLVHPAAYLDPTANLGEGVQIMAGAIIQPDVTIGANSIINTGASIDHDCSLSMDVHIAPGAILCGNIIIEESVFIGSGAVLGQGLKIGKGSVIGAGVSLVRDLPDNSKVYPAATRTISL